MTQKINILVFTITVFLGLNVEDSVRAAQETNAPSVVQQWLDEFGSVPVTRPVEVVRSRRVCQNVVNTEEPVPQSADKMTIMRSRDCWYEDFVTTENRTRPEILRFSEITYLLTDKVVFFDPVFDEIPRKLFIASTPSLNCEETESSASATLTLNIGVSNSITLTKTITNATGGNVGIRFIVEDVGDISGQVNISRQVSMADQKSETVSETVIVTRTGTKNIPPKHKTLIQLLAYRIHGKVPFETAAIIDSKVSRNDKGYKKLSDIFDEKKRSIRVEGLIDFDGVSEGSIRFLEAKFEPSECETGATLKNESDLDPKTFLVIEEEK